MMTSTITSSYETQPAYEDPDASVLANLHTSNYMMTSPITSSYEIPHRTYEDPDTSVVFACYNFVPSETGDIQNGIPESPASDYMMTSTISSSYEIPQPDYEDLDALKPAVTDGSQSEVKAKPVPRPRSKIKPKAQCNNNNNTSDSVDKTDNTSSEVSSPNNECPADYKRLHPVRPPPRPPMNKLLISSKLTAAPGGGNQYVISYTEPTVKPPAVSTEKTQNPSPRPERPPPPSFYYGKPSSTTGTQSKSRTEESQQSTYSPTSTKQTPVSPPVKMPSLYGKYGEMATDSKDRPAVPPRPRQSLPPSYASVCESSPPQIRPPPPQFHPPPPPSTESVYSEIDNCPYLEILPADKDKMIRPPPRPPSTSSESVYLEILPENQDKMKQGRSMPRSAKRNQSSSLPLHQQTTEDTDEVKGMLRWLKMVSRPNYMTPSVYGLSIEEEIRSFNQRAMNISKALRLYNLLMMKRNESLRNTITELTSISDSLDKMQKKTKTMGIAGGTTGAVGGVAAVVGIALAPVTMGASLIATAVGAGMVASAGGIGAHTAKASKKIVNRMTVEKLVNEYKTNVIDLEHCLDFILSGMNELQRHDIARLQRAGAQSEAVKMAHLSQSVFRNNMNMSVVHTGGMSSERLLLAFSDEMDVYFTEKDGQKLKKLNKSKFSGRIRLLAKNLQDGLEHLNCMWETFT